MKINYMLAFVSNGTTAYELAKLREIALEQTQMNGDKVMKKKLKDLTEEDVKKICKKHIGKYGDCYNKCPLYVLPAYGTQNCYLDLQEHIKEAQKLENEVEVEE